MALADHTVFFKEKPNIHIVIPYSDFTKLNDLVATFFNEGLKRNQLCVYCSMDLDGEAARDLVSKIVEYEKNVSYGNLLMIDLKPYFESIIEDDYGRFEVLKKLVSMKIRDREDKHVRCYGELTDYLFEKKFFDQCMSLEQFWQKNPLGGTTLCPFRTSVFDQEALKEKREQVIHSHDNILLC